MWRVGLMAFVKFNGSVIAEIPYIASEIYLMVRRLFHGNYWWSVFLFLTL